MMRSSRIKQIPFCRYNMQRNFQELCKTSKAYRIFEKGKKVIESLGYELNDIEGIYKFKAQRTIGICKIRRISSNKFKCIIGINQGIKCYEELENVILHELAHAVKGLEYAGHNRDWQGVASAISSATGHKISRLIYNTSVPQQANIKRYAIECLDCGQVIERVRMSKIMKNYQRYSCGKCGGKFKFYKL